jgi:hypothetical protein
LNHQTENLSNGKQGIGMVRGNEKQRRDGVIDASFIQKQLNGSVIKGREY